MSDRARLADIEPEDDVVERVYLPGDEIADVDLIVTDRAFIARNDGAARGRVLAPWESMSDDAEERGDHDDRMGAGIGEIMAGPDSAQRRHRERGAGGGGESTGRAKPRESRGATGAGKVPDARAQGEPNEAVFEYRVYGLTIGEREYFHARSGEAATHLRELVRMIRAEQWPESDVVERPDAPTKTLHAYGMTEAECTVLRKHPGAARAHLSMIARAAQGARIARLDANS